MSDNIRQETANIHCNECLRKTKHSVSYRKRHRTPMEPYDGYDLNSNIEWITENTVFVCCGCESVKLRRMDWCSEWTSYNEGNYEEVSFYPPPVSRRLLEWHKKLPSEIQSLLNEIYTALHSDSRRLALMGARTVIDLFVLDKIGDVGTFQKKIQALVDRGYLGSQQQNTLNVAIDAGNAAAHRGYNPSSEVLNHVIDVIEHLVLSYVFEEESQSIKENIPKRNKEI